MVSGVGDWGGFEELVAQLNETGAVTVERNVKLVGKSGAPRQIDVLIRHKQGLYEHIVIVECKYLRRNVDRSKVDELVKTVQEVNAAKGVLFSAVGFQSGAITQAKHDGIDLFKIRELTDAEWGLPGRIVSLYLHVIGVAIWDPTFPNAMGAGAIRQPVRFDLTIGHPEQDTKTAIKPPADGAEQTLETLIYRVARSASDQLRGSPQVLFGGSNGRRRLWGSALYRPPTAIIVPIEGGEVHLPEIAFNVGMELLQSHLRIDRGKDQLFALALDDCVRGAVVAASRKKNDKHTTLTSIHVPNEPPVGALQNGTLITVGVAGFQDAAQFQSLRKGRAQDEIECIYL